MAAALSSVTYGDMSQLRDRVIASDFAYSSLNCKNAGITAGSYTSNQHKNHLLVVVRIY
jgi:hypothetical protein